MFAASHPDRTTSLIEFGTYARMAVAPDYPQGIDVKMLRQFNQAMVESWGDPSMLGFWAPSLADDEETRKWWAKLMRYGSGPAGGRALWEMYEQMDVRPLLPLVRVPALILWRDEDRLIPPRLSRFVAEGIPGARSVELRGSDHIVFAGDQEAVLGEVEEFVTGRAQRSTHRAGLGDGSVHRHRRFDRAGRIAGRPALAGAPLRSTTASAAARSSAAGPLRQVNR